MATGTVHLEPGIPRTGLWCARCRLPSVVEVNLYGWTRTSWSMGLMGRARWCTECGHQPRVPDG